MPNSILNIKPHFLNYSCCVDWTPPPCCSQQESHQCPRCSLRVTKLNVIYTSRGKLSVFAISTQMILWEGNGGLRRALRETSCCFSSDNGALYCSPAYWLWSLLNALQNRYISPSTALLPMEQPYQGRQPRGGGWPRANWSKNYYWCDSEAC